MSKQNTIGEMEAKVKEGLRIAREATNDPDLLKLCDDLEYTWDDLAAKVIIVGVGLSAMKYRTPDQIRAQLTEYLNLIREGKSRSMRIFTPDNELSN
jgi:hypothetical protein